MRIAVLGNIPVIDINSHVQIVGIQLLWIAISVVLARTCLLEHFRQRVQVEGIPKLFVLNAIQMIHLMKRGKKVYSIIKMREASSLQLRAIPYHLP